MRRSTLGNGRGVSQRKPIWRPDTIILRKGGTLCLTKSQQIRIQTRNHLPASNFNGEKRRAGQRCSALSFYAHFHRAGSLTGGVRPSNSQASGFKSTTSREPEVSRSSTSAVLSLTSTITCFPRAELPNGFHADSGNAQHGPEPETVGSPHEPIPLSPTAKHS